MSQGHVIFHGICIRCKKCQFDLQVITLIKYDYHLIFRMMAITSRSVLINKNRSTMLSKVNIMVQFLKLTS